MFIYVFKYHNPIVSTNTTSINDKIAIIIRDVENIKFNLFPDCFPISYVINRLQALEREDVKIVNVVTSPPTTLYIPKSSKPKADKIIFVV